MSVGRKPMIAGLCALSLASMVWAAWKPGDGLGSTRLLIVEPAISDFADWFRRGPADGHPDWDDAAHTFFDADPDRGAALMLAYGCTACHEIPGIVGANGSVGPSLAGLRDRAYLGGVVPNNPGGLSRWLMQPTVHAPETAMPDLGVTEADARDMGAYLYTLRGG